MVGRDLRVLNFLKDISPKVIVVARLKFELCYYGLASEPLRPEDSPHIFIEASCEAYSYQTEIHIFLFDNWTLSIIKQKYQTEIYIFSNRKF